jgi:hypothetical protein
MNPRQQRKGTGKSRVCFRFLKKRVKLESFKLGEIRIDEVKKFKAFSLQRYIKV